MVHNHYPQEVIDEGKDDSIAICTAIIDMVEKVDVKAILTLTASGYTPKLLSKAKPSVPILSSVQVTEILVDGVIHDVFPIEMDLNEGINQQTLEIIDKMLD